MKRSNFPTKSNTLIGMAAIMLLMVVQACTGDPNSPGVEYMPDMYRTPSIEAYVDYGLVGDSTSVELKNTMSARMPAEGSIPRGWMPYPYENNAQGYAKAGEELQSPQEVTLDMLAEGEVIYSKFCLHCHGAEGDGKGKVVANERYTAGPNAYNSDALKDIPVGSMYHVLMWGKNKMGSHASQINEKERWAVVNYVKYHYMHPEMEEALAGEGEAPEGDAAGEGDAETADGEAEGETGEEEKAEGEEAGHDDSAEHEGDDH